MFNLLLYGGLCKVIVYAHACVILYLSIIVYLCNIILNTTVIEMVFANSTTCPNAYFVVRILIPPVSLP